MPVFKTPFNGYSVKFNPFYESQLAVATSQNFGILENGRLHLFQLNPTITEITSFDTTDGVYDLCWSESHDSLFIAAVDDGSLKIYDLSLPPIASTSIPFEKTPF
ncbi:Peroxisome biogenesis protein 7 [Abeliophyllum distichum]|uniref:Peroxin-7 n=1 Tax=Abeliophyllum distichum TaxID=126358 RepID=A0ABD1W198_9LAMI